MINLVNEADQINHAEDTVRRTKGFLPKTPKFYACVTVVGNPKPCLDLGHVITEVITALVVRTTLRSVADGFTMKWDARVVE